MFVWVFFVYFYIFITVHHKYNCEVTDPVDETITANFVFGSNDPVEIVTNHSLFTDKFFVPFRLVLSNDNFFVYFVNDKFQRILRKNFRKVKKPKTLVSDQIAHHPSISCRICSDHKTCILLNPCGHVGVCNRCCYRLFNKAFYKTSKSPRCFFKHEPIIDHRLSNTNNDNLEDILNDLRVVQNKCPFCNNNVHDINYVYIC